MNLLPLADRFDFEELIVYVLIVVAIAVVNLLKWAAGKSARSRKEPGGPAAPGRPPPTQPQRRPAPPPRATGPMRVPGARRLVARRRAAAVPQPQIPPASWDVAEEVHRQQQRLERGEAQRSRRLVTAQPSEADTAAIEARLLHVRPQAQPTQAVTAASLLAGLRAPEQFRRAILHYEIFAPPKALRPGPEPWDL